MRHDFMRWVWDLHILGRLDNIKGIYIGYWVNKINWIISNTDKSLPCSQLNNLAASRHSQCHLQSPAATKLSMAERAVKHRILGGIPKKG
jgi:predicted DNA-binding protein (MmcQ/YjbR family)